MLGENGAGACPQCRKIWDHGALMRRQGTDQVNVNTESNPP